MGSNKCYTFSLQALLLQAIAMLLVLLFMSDALKIPVSLLEDKGRSYELFENIVTEECADESETEKNDKEEVLKEFILSSKASFALFLKTDDPHNSSYLQHFQSRSADFPVPPPKI